MPRQGLVVSPIVLGRVEHTLSVAREIERVACNRALLAWRLPDRRVEYSDEAFLWRHCDSAFFVVPRVPWHIPSLANDRIRQDGDYKSFSRDPNNRLGPLAVYGRLLAGCLTFLGIGISLISKRRPPA